MFNAAPLLNLFQYLERDIELIKRMVRFIQSVRGIIFCVEHIARHEKIVQLYFVEIAYRLHSRKLHLNRDTAVIFPLCNCGLCFSVNRVGRPYPSLNIREFQFLENLCKLIAVFDVDIIRRRSIMIGQPFIPVCLCRNDIFAVGCLTVKSARRTENDQLLKTRLPLRFDNKRTRKAGTDRRQIKYNIFIIYVNQKNGDVTVYRIDLTDNAMRIFF